MLFKDHDGRTEIPFFYRQHIELKQYNKGCFQRHLKNLPSAKRITERSQELNLRQYMQSPFKKKLNTNYSHASRHSYDENINKKHKPISQKTLVPIKKSFQVHDCPEIPDPKPFVTNRKTVLSKISKASSDLLNRLEKPFENNKF